MVCDIVHVGVTVTDLDRATAFYRDVLGMKPQGSLVMEGRETDILFGRTNSRARIAYFKGGDRLYAPPVELIQFTDQEVERQETELFRTSVSEICLGTDDIWAEYHRLSAQGVRFLSEPQEFDFTADGFGRSMAVYLRDPDGNILELMQAL